MALANYPIIGDVQITHNVYGSGIFSIPGHDHPSALELFRYTGHHDHANMILDEVNDSYDSPGSDSGGLQFLLLSDSSNRSSTGANPPLQEEHQMQWPYSSAFSLLSFDKGERAFGSKWSFCLDAIDQNYDLECSKNSSDAAVFQLIPDQDIFGLLYPNAAAAHGFQETVGHAKFLKKRPFTNRRERISERLRILQDLVPNGTKVDLVTMLEKAISYVKFLQLQVKVLATDEFWPAQGGKAPELSQVKEAIYLILLKELSASHLCNSIRVVTANQTMTRLIN